MNPDLNILASKNVYIIAVNRPGYSLSSLYGKYTFSSFSHDIKYLLDSFQIEKVDVIGWSAGGLFGQVFASLYPDSIRSLSLVSSSVL